MDFLVDIVPREEEVQREPESKKGDKAERGRRGEGEGGAAAGDDHREAIQSAGDAQMNGETAGMRGAFSRPMMWERSAHTAARADDKRG